MLKPKKLLATFISIATFAFSIVSTTNVGAVTVAQQDTAVTETEETTEETDSDVSYEEHIEEGDDWLPSLIYDTYGEVACNGSVASIIIPYDVIVEGCVISVPAIDAEVIGGTGKVSMEEYGCDDATEGTHYAMFLLNSESAGTVNVKVTVTDYRYNQTGSFYYNYNFVIKDDLSFDSEATTTGIPEHYIRSGTELKEDMVEHKSDYFYVVSAEKGLIVSLDDVLCIFDDAIDSDKLIGKQTVEDGDLINICDFEIAETTPGTVEHYDLIINYGSGYDVTGNEALTKLNNAVEKANEFFAYNLAHFRKYDIASYELLSTEDLKQDIQDYPEYYFYVLSGDNNVFANVSTGELYTMEEWNVDFGKKDVWTGDLVFIDTGIDFDEITISVCPITLNTAKLKKVINYGSAFDIFGKSALEEINTYIDYYNANCTIDGNGALDKMDIDSYNENPKSPSSEAEYESAIATYDDYVRNDGTSIYILNKPDVVNTKPYYVVSEYQKFGSFERYTLKKDSYGITFKPESDGVFVISEVLPLTYYCRVKLDSTIEYKYCYDVVITFVVTVEDGKISTRISKQQNYKNQNTIDAVEKEIKDTYNATGEVVYEEIVYEGESFDSTKSTYYSYLNELMKYDEDFDQTAIHTAYYKSFGGSLSEEYILIETIDGEVPTLESSDGTTILNFVESGTCAITSRREDLVSLANYSIFNIKYSGTSVVTDGISNYEISRKSDQNDGKLTMRSEAVTDPLGKVTTTTTTTTGITTETTTKSSETTTTSTSITERTTSSSDSTETTSTVTTITTSESVTRDTTTSKISTTTTTIETTTGTTLETTTESTARSTSETETTTVTEETIPIQGDIDQDGVVNADDAHQILQYYVQISIGNTEIQPSILKMADVNGDDKVDTEDAYVILLYYARTAVGIETNISEILQELKG